MTQQLVHLDALTNSKLFTPTPVGLIVNGHPTFEQWQLVMKQLSRMEGSVQFWIGDGLNHGEKNYGEKYAQAVDEKQAATWKQYAYVSANVQMSIRIDNLGWSYHQLVAPLTPPEQKRWLTKAEAEHWTVAQLRQAIRDRHHTEAVFPEGQYAVILADPPWQYLNSGFDESAESQYPTMATDTICAMPISTLATNSTVLFLWATNPLLPDALRVLAAWGFEYKTNMAWIKDRGRGKGWFLKSKHELLLIGTRPETPHPKVRPDSCFEANREPKHSKKPEAAYAIIEKMYAGKRIELFSREKRKGWDAYGNEC